MYRNFLEPELEELVIVENAEEWTAIAEEIGATGQVKLVKKETGENSNPIPYMPINRKWLKIFKTLCPAVEEYTKYGKSTIPLEGMRDIKFCIESKYFDKIEIWHSDVILDPFIVGVVGKSWEKQYFLVGQFGDELLPFEMLESKAIKKLTEGIRNQANAMIKNIENVVFEYLEQNTSPDIKMQNIHGFLS